MRTPSNPPATPTCFRRDLTTGETVLVSTGPNGPANSFSANATISADGTEVAFLSTATNLVDGVTVPQAIYVRDLAAGTTEVVSRGDGPTGAVTQSSFNPVISGDGNVVAFLTGEGVPATDGAVDNNSSVDVYARDRATTTTHLASVAHNSNTATGAAFGTPGIDFDGSAIAWVTVVSVAHINSAITDGTGTFDVYLRERSPARTFLISHGPSTQAGVVISRPPAVSGGGDVVAWSTNTAVAGGGVDSNGVTDVYATSVASDVVSLVSRESGATGPVGNGASFGPAFGTGATTSPVAFETEATNFGSDGNDTVRDVAVRSLSSFTTTLATGTAGEGLRRRRVSSRRR